MPHIFLPLTATKTRLLTNNKQYLIRQAVREDFMIEITSYNSCLTFSYFSSEKKIWKHYKKTGTNEYNYRNVSLLLLRGEHEYMKPSVRGGLYLQICGNVKTTSLPSD